MRTPRHSFFESLTRRTDRRRRFHQTCRYQRLISRSISPAAASAEPLESRVLLSATHPVEFLDPNPSADNGFGTHIVPLSTGSVVVTAPRDDAGGTNAGAVYLFNGATGELISTLTGSSPSDQVGANGVIKLPGGNFLIPVPLWDNENVVNAGAVVFGNGLQGVQGAVSVSNSLVGSSNSDQVGSTPIVILSNGNYVVTTHLWDNGAIVDAGAVTFGSGVEGVRGPVSIANSLVGTTANDRVGSDGIRVLSTGNFLISSRYWRGESSSGAVTFASALTGVTGAVSSQNSLIDTHDSLTSAPITTLSNGNYLVTSPDWHGAGHFGAVTFGSGTTGISGIVSESISFIGVLPGHSLGPGPVAELSNGNFVIISERQGSVTFGNGTAGIRGVLSSSNSLIGFADDGLSVTPLENGNYVITNRDWDNGPVQDVGIAVYGNGVTGTTGVLNAAMGLTGATAGDRIGSGGIHLLPDGSLAIRSPLWDNAGAADAGAVTHISGPEGLTGVVSTDNSLTGSSPNDMVGSGIVEILENGNYLINSPNWNNGQSLRAGAVTFVNLSAGITGVVSASNSLIGTSTDDMVGSAFNRLLPNGNYLVPVPGWDNGSIKDTGAVTFGNGTIGVSGVVSSSNSLVGSSLNDQIGADYFFTIRILSNSNYLISSKGWDNGSIANAGAVTLGSGVTGVTGEINATNSLIGTQQGAQVGFSTTVLDNDGYVVQSFWRNQAGIEVGAVTYGHPETGVTGAVTPANSLIGTSAGDMSGTSILGLTGGKYVVISPDWDRGSVVNAGAVTFVDPARGTSGVISESNSLYGQSVSDRVGSAGVDALTNGGYLVLSDRWNNGPIADAGAVTFGSGANGVIGPVSALNSLVGGATNDRVGHRMGRQGDSAVTGAVGEIENGQFIVVSPNVDSGGTVNVGAVSFGSISEGLQGVVSPSNSFVGQLPNTRRAISDPISQREFLKSPGDAGTLITAIPQADLSRFRLDVRLSGNESLTIWRSGSSVEVLINGTVDPRYSYQAATLGSISVTGGAGGNSIDLSGITRSAFPELQQLRVRGGDGNDTITGSDLADWISGESGDDVIVAGLGSDSLFGGSGGDHLTAGEGDDQIDGESGNDTILGNGGRDTLTGGDGINYLNAAGPTGDIVRERVHGSTTLATNLLIWNTGRNTMSGVESAELIGSGSADHIDIGGWVSGSVTVRGGAGNDTVLGSAVRDIVDGESGNDSILGAAGFDVLLGGAGHDYLRGDDGEDYLEGGSGQDTLLGAAGKDTLSGGPGVDFIDGQGTSNDMLRESIFGQAVLTRSQLTSGVDADRIRGIERAQVFGSSGHDRIDLRGFDGATTIAGEAGNDTIFGGAGFDRIFGGNGHDQIDAGAAVDIVMGQAGNDTIDGGDGDNDLRGDEGDDVIRGRGGNDRIYGGHGHDTLLGGSGNDWLAGGNGNDMSLIESGRDTVRGGSGPDRLAAIVSRPIQPGPDLMVASVLEMIDGAFSFNFPLID